jgi:hypothetical protein
VKFVRAKSNDITTAAFERLLIFITVFLLIVHLLSCSWIAVAKFLSNDYYMTWMRENNYQELSNHELYVVSVYYIVTTITTVGYGDILAKQRSEMILAIFTMIFGVVSFSFIAGSLSSIMTSADSG